MKALDFNDLWRSKIHFHWLNVGKWPSKKWRPYTVVVLFCSMSNYADLTPSNNRKYYFSRKCKKKQSNQNGMNLSSNWAPLKWDLILIKMTCGLIYKLSLSFHFFSTSACLSSYCVRNILAHIYLRWPKSNYSGGVHLNVAWSAGFW